jgi:DNA (cytosine-5)-methyltransferase 1
MNRVVALFSGAGGLDLGFKRAGFDVQWANEYDKTIWQTYRENHKNCNLDTRSITSIHVNEVPECDGIIGGPPCQSWSSAGSLRGIKDQRGQLFFDYIRILDAKKPMFFLAENVAGMLANRHAKSLSNIKAMLSDCGYKLYFKLLNAADYEVPQDRKRVIFIGIRNDIDTNYKFPKSITPKLNLRQTIWDLKDSAQAENAANDTKGKNVEVLNHEYLVGGFSSLYMSRNRVRAWDQQSFTIQAGGRHAPLHPQAPKMEKIHQDKRIFSPGYEHLYRRLSVRECARIQTFPDDFEFIYSNILNGYKMIGNAVPVNFAFHLAYSIKTLFCPPTNG